MENRLDRLVETYVEEQRVAAQLKEHAREIPYDFLRKKVEKIVEEDLLHAKFLEEKIKENGGSLPAAPALRIKGGFLRDKLAWDLRDKQMLEARYIELANQILDEQEELGKALRKIAREEREHESLLMEILMKINP
jgi:ferritin-like metal-binding protein YciE